MKKYSPHVRNKQVEQRIRKVSHGNNINKFGIKERSVTKISSNNVLSTCITRAIVEPIKKK